MYLCTRNIIIIIIILLLYQSHRKKYIGNASKDVSVSDKTGGTQCVDVDVRHLLLVVLCLRFFHGNLLKCLLQSVQPGYDVYRSINEKVFKVVISSDKNESRIKCILDGKLRNSNASRFSWLKEIIGGHLISPELFYTVMPASCKKTVMKEQHKDDAYDAERMRYEWARYESFKTFSVSSPMNPMTLAQSGFYFNGTGDETICFSCRLTHSNWKSGDVPREVHKILSPRCRFINGMETGNVPIDEYVKPSKVVTSVNESLTGQRELSAANPQGTCSPTPKEDRQMCAENKQPSNVNRHKISTTKEIHTEDHEKPIRPEFEVFNVRVSSFKGWPSTMHLSPRALAEAGLFYAGFGDCVRCYQCGGGLRNWEYGNDPWVEHARWYPRCSYVRKHKGDSFINEVQEELHRVEVAARSTTEEACGNEELKQKSPTTNSSRTKGQEMLLQSVPALSVLEMGYKRDSVSKAIKAFHAKGGTATNMSAQALLEIILDSEEETGQTFATSRESGTPEYNADTEESGELSKHAENTDKNKTNNPSNFQSSNALKELLLKENRQLKETVICKICMDNDACVVFLPCSHMVACQECAPALRKCPICRKLIRRTVRAYLS